jgi:hypothetical protein
MRYAYIADGVIKAHGALPFLWSADGNQPQIDLHAKTQDELKQIGWIPMLEVGRREYDALIEVETVEPVSLVSGEPIQYVTYAYKSNYKELMFQRVAGKAYSLGEQEYAYQKNPKALNMDALNPQERLVIETTTKIAEARVVYKNNSQRNIDYEGLNFQADNGSRDKVLVVLTTYPTSLPIDFFWLDSTNNKISVTREFLQGLSQLIAARDFAEFALYTDTKKSIKDTFMANVV